MRSRPIVVQHSSGLPGAGGPATVLGRVMNSRLAEKYSFVPMHQSVGTGGIDARLIATWVRLLRETKPDLVHIRGLQNEGFQAILAAKIAQCRRVLVTVHGSTRDLKFAGPSLRRSVLVNLAEPATLRLASHVGTVCRFAAEREFVAKHRRKLIGVIPNGVAVPELDAQRKNALRDELAIPNASVALIAVSRLTWEKGFRTLYEAVKRLAPTTPATTLLIVGDGPDASEIQKLFASLTQVDVRFMGRRLDVGDLLRAADVFVFPTLHENLSNALLEAMSYGLPVVASAVGGNMEVLEGGGGILVPPSDPSAFAGAVRRLSESSDLRRNLGEQAREVIRQSYSDEVMLSTLDKTYEQAIEGDSLR